MAFLLLKLLLAQKKFKKGKQNGLTGFLQNSLLVYLVKFSRNAHRWIQVRNDFVKVLVVFVTCILLIIQLECCVSSVLLLVEKQQTFKILCGEASDTHI